MNTLAKSKNRNDSLSNFNQRDTLLIAIGNSARSDDGLGWAFLDKLKESYFFEGETTYCYQLQVEDAEMISTFQKVIFVDASEEKLQNGFGWKKTIPQNDFTFTTHALTPEAVLFLCENLYKKTPEAYTLKIQGNHWELKTGLSKSATKNLEKALKHFEETIKMRSKFGSLLVNF